VKRGVKAGHRGEIGQTARHGIQGRQGLRLMQGGQVGELLEAAAHLLVDDGRADIAFTAVDDTVSDGVRATQ
jgi:hypothetical protein